MVTVDDVRAVASPLPRSYEVLVRDRVKFRVGRIVYLAFSADETIMGFAFPKEEREALVASEPGKFLMPGQSDLRYNWVHVRLGAIEPPRWPSCPRRLAHGRAQARRRGVPGGGRPRPMGRRARDPGGRPVAPR